MKHEDLLNYVTLFREKAEQGKLIVFVGAGVSQNVKDMPGWNDLIQRMAEAINYSKCDSCSHKAEGCENNCLLKNDFSTDEYLKIPQYVFNQNEESYYNVLKDNIHDVEIDAPLSSAIFDINPAHIITTNYDRLLETSKNTFCEQYEVIIHDKDLLNARKGKYIIKMHGDLHEPETMVLKEQDYLDYSQNHVLIELFIKSLLADHIVMFLGYSVNDYNIKLILSWLNYMRSQNNVFDDSRRIGYLIQDREEIDITQSAYFSNNNIEVVNIHSMPLIDEIPAELSNDMGKRLYSFLSVISNPALEKNLFSIEKTVEFLSQFDFVSCKNILNSLYITDYVVMDRQLQPSYRRDCARLIDFMSKDEKASEDLKRLFLNAGITSIYDGSKSFIIGEFSQNSVFQDKLYRLYIQNKYDEIKALLEDGTEIEINEKAFYESIVDGYAGITASWDDLTPNYLSSSQKIAYLHNTSVIESFIKRPFMYNNAKIEKFVHNLSSSRERDIFSEYLEILSDNVQKRQKMYEELQGFKYDVSKRNILHCSGISNESLYKIKPLCYMQYLYYYNNHLFYQGYSILGDFFKPYIEAVICANSDAAEAPTYLWGVPFKNEKYCIDLLDFDIITKFISSKDLSAIVKEYSITQFKVVEGGAAFLVNCFKNLCHSIVASKTYGYQYSSLTVLSNIALMLNLICLDNDSKAKAASAVTELVSDETAVSAFFSMDWQDYKYGLKELSTLCNSLTFTPDFEAVKRVINSKGIFIYAANVNFNNLRHLIGHFLASNDDTSKSIENIVDSIEDFSKKVILLRLFYRYISDETIQQKYKDFLSGNFNRLNTSAIYDFVFSNWLIPTQESIGEYINTILDINRNKTKGVQTYPDPVETKLECVYLLYINDIIDNIRALNELCEGRPHLQFLLDPDGFDYTQVDFSNYMWANFARNRKYVKYFVAHRKDIIPKIQERIKAGIESEDEKKILYGFLLEGDEVWEI